MFTNESEITQFMTYYLNEANHFNDPDFSAALRNYTMTSNIVGYEGK